MKQSRHREKHGSPAGRIELGICLAATLAGAGLHFVYFTHAGALWRDEAGGIQLATLPAFSETWRMLAHDGFPVFFPALVRIWSALGLGTSDVTLRVLGFLIGLGLLGAMWLNARIMGFRLPFISLGLLAANVTVVTWGDSLRAYGCGSLFILITLGLVWKLVQAPGRTSFLLAALAAVLSVQTLFQNAFLVLAASIAGGVVCARHRQWKTAGLVFGVGLVAGASLIPYLPLIIESQSWWLLQKVGFNLAFIWNNMMLAGGSYMDWPFGAWLGLIPLALGAGLAALLQRTKSEGIGQEDLPLYSASALVAGIAGFLVFLRISELGTNPWYYLPLMVFAATAMDAALADWCRLFRIWSAAFLVCMICLLSPATLQFAGCRQTNIDLIAAELQDRAEPGDFIMVTPCHCGITFDRYYKGRIPWTTLPALTDHRFHRFDLLKKKLCEASPVKPELERAAQTLASGHTLWLVIESPNATSGKVEPADPPRAPIPNVPWPWWEGYYTFVWKDQLEYLVAAHAEQREDIPVKPGICVNSFENLSLIRASGWHEKAEAQPGSEASP
jgi:hypothetical protein